MDFGERPAALFSHQHAVTRARLHVYRPVPGGSIMSKGSTTKANVKKKGKTIKEKQSAKRLKREEQKGHSSNIPSTGH
jgi:hypothetical protein